jgi:hypothetical protein
MEGENFTVAVIPDELKPTQKLLTVSADTASMKLSFTPLALPNISPDDSDHDLRPMDATKTVVIRGVGRKTTIRGTIVPKQKMSPVTISCDEMESSFLELVDSEEVSSTPFATSKDFEIVVHEAQEGEVRSTTNHAHARPICSLTFLCTRFARAQVKNTRHVSVTSKGAASLKWCGQLHWCAMAAVKMQSKTEKEIKRLLNGGVPKPPSTRAPIYATVKALASVSVDVIFSPSEKMAISTASVLIDVADLPGRSKPSVKMKAGATTVVINDVYPAFVALDAFQFDDTFRIATPVSSAPASEASAKESCPTPAADASSRRQQPTPAADANEYSFSALASLARQRRPRARFSRVRSPLSLRSRALALFASLRSSLPHPAPPRCTHPPNLSLSSGGAPFVRGQGRGVK